MSTSDLLGVRFTVIFTGDGVHSQHRAVVLQVYPNGTLLAATRAGVLLVFEAEKVTADCTLLAIESRI